MKHKLTDLENMFVKEYLYDLNATKACLRAGYDTANPGNLGSELLGKTWVKDEINKEILKREQRLQIKSDDIINELAKIAFADRTKITKVVNGKLQFTDTDELATEIKSAISEMSESKFGKSIKTNDKVEALKLLGKHFGSFTENITHDVNITSDLTDNELADIATGRRKRAAEKKEISKEST